MQREQNQPPQPPIGKRLLTMCYIVLAGGAMGVVTTVILRAWQEIQQQLGSGAAPGILALVVRLIFTALSLLAGATDAVVDGATTGLGLGLIAALVYGGYRAWRRPKPSITIFALLLILLTAGLSGAWLGLDWSIHLPTASASPAPPTLITPQNGSKVVALAQLPTLDANQVVYSPNSQQIILATAQGAAVYELATQQKVRTIGTGVITRLALSPDGQTIATVSGHEVQLWAVGAGQLLHTLRHHHGAIQSVAFSPDGHILASAALDRTARLWQVRNGALLYTLPHLGDLHSVAFAADGRTLSTGSSLGTTLWDTATGGRLQLVDVALNAATAVQFSPIAPQLALGLDNGSLRLGPIDNYGKAVGLDGHTGGINALAFTPAGTLLASAGADHSVYLWDTQSGAQVAALRGHVNQVVSVAFSPDGRTLTTVGWDATVRIWGVAGGALVSTPAQSPLPTATQVAVAPAGTGLLTVETVDQWKPQLLLKTKGVADLAYAADGRWLAVAGETVTIYDSTTMKPHQEIAVKTASLRFSPNGQWLATVEGKVVKVWAVADGTVRHQYDIHTDSVEEVAFSPDGTLLATAARDKEVRIFQVESEQLARQLGHFGQVRSLAFSPDGATLATGSTVGAVLWRVSDGARLRLLTIGLRAIDRVAFSPDGQALAVALDNGAIKLWRQGGLGESVDLTRHSGPVLALTFSPDNTLLASAGADGTVRLWRVGDGAPLRLLADYTGLATAVAFRPDGKALLVATTEDGVTVWQLGK